MAYGTYDKSRRLLNTIFPGTTGDLALEAAAAAILDDLQVEPITVTRFGFIPTVAFDYDTQTAEGVLTLYRYPVAGGAGKVALATIPLEDLALIDNVYYVDVDNPPVAARGKGRADIDAGERVVIEITTAATGGGAIAGDFHPFFDFHPRAEVEDNQTTMHDRNADNTI